MAVAGGSTRLQRSARPEFWRWRWNSTRCARRSPPPPSLLSHPVHALARHCNVSTSAKLSCTRFTVVGRMRFESHIQNDAIATTCVSQTTAARICGFTGVVSINLQVLRRCSKSFVLWAAAVARHRSARRPASASDRPSTIEPLRVDAAASLPTAVATHGGAGTFGDGCGRGNGDDVAAGDRIALAVGRADGLVRALAQRLGDLEPDDDDYDKGNRSAHASRTGVRGGSGGSCGGSDMYSLMDDGRGLGASADCQWSSVEASPSPSFPSSGSSSPSSPQRLRRRSRCTRRRRSMRSESGSDSDSGSAHSADMSCRGASRSSCRGVSSSPQGASPVVARAPPRWSSLAQPPTAGWRGAAAAGLEAQALPSLSLPALTALVGDAEERAVPGARGAADRQGTSRRLPQQSQQRLSSPTKFGATATADLGRVVRDIFGDSELATVEGKGGDGAAAAGSAAAGGPEDTRWPWRDVLRQSVWGPDTPRTPRTPRAGGAAAVATTMSGAAPPRAAPPPWAMLPPTRADGGAGAPGGAVGGVSGGEARAGSPGRYYCGPLRGPGSPRPRGSSGLALLSFAPSPSIAAGGSFLSPAAAAGVGFFSPELTPRSARGLPPAPCRAVGTAGLTSPRPGFAEPASALCATPRGGVRAGTAVVAAATTAGPRSRVGPSSHSMACRPLPP
jgi:hypothetical protein